MTERERRLLAKNRIARHRYYLSDPVEAGIELRGTEVKAIRAGRVNLKEAHVQFEAGEAFLVGCHIGAYEHSGYTMHDPVRRRRLLLHRRQIDRMGAKVREKGITAVPTAIYLDGNWIKLEIHLGVGKKLHDKRETLRQRTLDRDAELAMKDHD